MADTPEPAMQRLSFKEFDAQTKAQGIDAFDMTGGFLVTYPNLELLVNRSIDDTGTHYSLAVSKLSGGCPVDSLLRSLLNAVGKSLGGEIPSREFIPSAKRALSDLNGKETLTALEQVSTLIHFAERPTPNIRTRDAVHSTINAEREAKVARDAELKAIHQQFPHIRHDVDFQQAVLAELQRMKTENPELDNATAAATIKQGVARNAALNGFLPAYDALLAEIGRYNKNPFDNRWIHDTSCWEKYVKEQRAKGHAASNERNS